MKNLIGQSHRECKKGKSDGADEVVNSKRSVYNSMMFSKDKNKPHKTSLNHCHRICRLLKDQDEHQILIGSRRNNSDVIVVARFAQDQFVTKMFIEQMVCVDVCVF